MLSASTNNRPVNLIRPCVKGQKSIDVGNGKRVPVPRVTIRQIFGLVAEWSMIDREDDTYTRGIQA